MKRKGIKIGAVILSTMILCMSFTACTKTGEVNGSADPEVTEQTNGEENTGDETVVSGNESGEATVGLETPAEEESDLLKPDENGKITVSTVQDLVNAIQPDVTVVIEPGVYNISNFLNTIPDLYDWNKSHKYVKVREQFDGREMVIQDAHGIHITSKSENYSDTELITEPRYVAVLYFNATDNVEISGLTMGHTDVGQCVGDVVDFKYCKNPKVDNCDFYGCGVYGIGCEDNTQNLYVSNTILRDCSQGPFSIINCKGEYIFTDCTFTGSDYGGVFYDYRDRATIKFVRCTFGQNESNEWAYYDESLFEDCTLMEPNVTPEEGYGDDEDYMELYEEVNEDGSVG